MAIDLLNLEPQMISKNLRGKYIMIYGAAGCGKTTLASKFEKVLIAGFECGTNALNNVYVQPIKTWQDWKQMVSQLCRKDELKDKFHSIAIDTVEEAWSLCTKFICTQNGINSLGDLAWGAGYDLAKKEFAQTFRDLAYSGYGLIFICHSTEKTMKNDRGEEYIIQAPSLSGAPFGIVNKMVDIIAYIREVGVEVNDQVVRKRYMFMRDEIGDRYMCKSRYKYIVPRVELNYNNLVEAIYNAIDAEVEHSGGEATEDENPYMTLNFEELIEEAKILYGQALQKELMPKVSEILERNFGKKIKFSEIDPSQVDILNKALIEIRDIV